MLGPKKVYTAEIVVILLCMCNLMCSAQKKVIKAGVNTFGRLFVMALPEVRAPDSDVFFFLHTLELQNMTVTISTRYRNPEVSNSYAVSRNRYQMVKISQVFTATSDILAVRWTHVLEGNRSFQVSVMFYSRNGDFCSAMQAVPVSGWGTYYLIITPRYLPSLQIVNGPTSQTVLIYFVSEYKESLLYKNKTYGNMWTVPVQVQSFEGISMQNCSKTRGLHGSFTGSHLSAYNPFGVIVGSCLVIDNSTRVFADTVLDMIPVVSSFGKTFITFPLVLASATSYLVLSSSVTFVKVTLHELNGGKKSMIVEYPHDPERIENTQFAKLIVAERLIQVHILLEMTCVGNMTCGDLSMSTVVPFGLYMDNYYWITPNKTNLQHGVIVLHQSNVSQGLLLNTQSVTSIKSWVKVSDVQGLGNWQSSQFGIEAGHYYMHSARGYRYAVYLYGWANNKSYIQPAGYISSPGEMESCDMKGASVAGDMIDDDCDGMVDEEAPDGKDNDRDGKIDEDTALAALVNGQWSGWSEGRCDPVTYLITRSRNCTNPPPSNGGMNCEGNNTESEGCGPNRRATTRTTVRTVTTTAKAVKPAVTTTSVTTTVRTIKPVIGVWAEWTMWTCLQNCSVTTQLRTRSCVHPVQRNQLDDCVGLAYQVGSDPCRSCSRDCPGFWWGENCNYTCQNCEMPCNFYTGVCLRCNPGYRSPHLACVEECKHFSFGYDCRGSCLKECEGNDCVERITGTCPVSSKSWYALFLLLLVPIGLLLCLRLRHRDQNVGEISDVTMTTGKSDTMDKSSSKRSRSVSGRSSSVKSSQHSVRVTRSKQMPSNYSLRNARSHQV